jgi:hypothetical protein
MLFERFHANLVDHGKIKVPRRQLLHAFVKSIRDEPIEFELQRLQVFLENFDADRMPENTSIKDILDQEYGNKEILVLDRRAEELVQDIEEWPESVGSVPIFSQRIAENGE